MARGPRRGLRRWAAGLAVLGLASACTPAVPGDLEADVRFLASDALGGRDNGSPGSAMARARILDVLRPIARGADPARTGDDAYLQAFPGGTNVVAVIPGTSRPREYVVVGAHYDHLGSRCPTADPADHICNGATDDATGTAAVLEIARRVAAAPLRRSVVVALWDREEDGLLGSQYYVAHPLVPLADTVAYVNFDIQGADVLPSLRSTTFAVGAETGGSTLRSIVRSAAAPSPLDVASLSAVFGQFRSDYAPFLGARVPSVFFTDASGPCYHTAQDDASVVDLPKLAHQVDTADRVVRRLASRSGRPAFASGAPIATFADAVAMAEVVDRSWADRSRFSAEDQAGMAAVREELHHLVDQGAKNFGEDEVGDLFSASLDAVEILTHGPCDGFLPSA